MSMHGQDLNAQLDQAESEIAAAKEKINATEQQLTRTKEELDNVSDGITVVYFVCVYSTNIVYIVDMMLFYATSICLLVRSYHQLGNPFPMW